MILTNVRFIQSMSAFSSFPGDALPKIAVVGKSNVGKSSLINALCNNKKMAKVSQTPGKTRLINLFNVNEQFVLVDLPGYGFAKVSKTQQATWGDMVDDFLRNVYDMRLILHLIDIRHDPSAEDIQMSMWLRHFDIPFMVVLTKADKLSRAQQQRSIMSIARKIATQPFDMLPFSAQTMNGRDALIASIHKAVLDDEALPALAPYAVHEEYEDI